MEFFVNDRLIRSIRHSQAPAARVKFAVVRGLFYSVCFTCTHYQHERDCRIRAGYKYNTRLQFDKLI